MHTRTDQRRRRGRDGSLTALRLICCLLLLGATLFLRTFFPATVDVMRERVLPHMEVSIDYRGAIRAIGESIAGDVPLLEVLGDITIRAFRGVESEPEPMKVQAAPEKLEPIYPPEIEQLVTHPPIEQIIYIPEPDLPWLREPEPEPPPATPPEEPMEIQTPAAVEAFLAHLERFSVHDLPASVSLSYAPLPIAFVAPISGTVSSGFGFRTHPLLGEVRFHFGVDIARYTGVPFYAFADGYVVEAAECPGFGLYILLDHGYGIYTRYGHASALYVQPGQRVERGAVIGRVGMTGGATGPHLHFELLVDGQFRNPLFYLSFAA